MRRRRGMRQEEMLEEKIKLSVKNWGSRRVGMRARRRKKGDKKKI